ncbi:MAG TPA: M14 family zinc carboxypeptidase [Bacteroidales bacterium]|nr:M14 family zinc carboxypeptidase [Bacteroidales bacterium]
MYLKFLLTALISLCLLPEGFTQQKNITTEIETVFGQKGEIYFQFEAENTNLPWLSKIISIDKVNGKKVFAYANKKEFTEFLKNGISYQLLPKPGELLKNPKMLDNVNIKEITEWDFYPTYEGYVDMMNQFETNYSEICQVFSIGQSLEGRELLMAKISKNVGIREAEPQFLYTGTMHGDETTGYVLLLRLIDYLLENYGSDPKVTYLLDHVEIWINPAANPDGTYHGGNNTVNGAIRYNANYIDLNRNYPDPEDGPHPDGNAWQVETVAFMQLAEEQHFVMSANTHGGSEVLNYPWDTWANMHADNDWWIYVCRQYVDTVHLYSPGNYYNEFNNGITNGYAWYSISGGRQDYMNYFHNCREVTNEMSDVKLLPASQLPDHWDWNYRSLLNYIEQCTFGITGLVTNMNNGNPVSAKINIEGHDVDNSFVFADPETGHYQRLLEAGTYDVTFSAPGYYPVTINNVSVSRYTTTTLNVQMETGELTADFSASATSISIGNTIDFQDESYGAPTGWLWEFEGGTPATSQDQHPQNILYQTEGSYDVTLTVSDNNGNQNTITKENYISVNAEFLMSNQTLTICNGVFYDSGGENQNYDNDENYVMTIFPETPGSSIIVQFLAFDVEYNSTCDFDWLKIFNGANTQSTLIGTYCGTSSPGTVEANNPEGALTFQFVSDYSVTKSGWKAQISCSIIGLPPIAQFIADKTEIFKGESVQFTDLSQNNPASWQWTFEGGNPATSGEQNPYITYPDLGTFDVKLVVQNEYGTDSVLYEDYISVDSAAGFSEHESSDISVFPNPCPDRTIHLAAQTPVTRAIIIDLYGTENLSKSFAPSTSVSLPVGSLKNGVYLLKVQHENGWSSSKITIIR